LVLLLDQKLTEFGLLLCRPAEDDAHVFHRHSSGNGPAIQISTGARHKRATQLDGTSVVDWTHDAAFERLLCDR
jgi:hypothetical protein